MLKLNERVNIEKLNKVVNSSFLEQDDVKKLEIYLKKFGNGDFIEVEYEKKYENFGRYYGSNIQSIGKQIRNYICSDYCVDLDMVNCHSVLLLNEFKKRNIVSKELQEYVDNRESILKKFKVDKQMISKCINFFDFQSPFEFFNNINKVVYQTFYPLLRNDKNLDGLWKFCIKLKEAKSNKQGTFIAWYLQTIEANVMDFVFEFLKTKDILVHTHMYDGFLLYKNDLLTDDLLGEISEYVKTKEYDVTFVYKPMLYDELEKNLIEEENNYSVWKDKFEINHFYVRKPQQTYCEINEKGLPEYYDIVDLINWYKLKSDFNIKFLGRWSSDLNKKHFDFCDFYPPPLKCPKNVYNLWKGFEIENYPISYEEDEKEPVIKNFINFISHLNSDEQNCIDFMLNHYAHMIQYPGEKNGIGYVISGTGGSGKGTNYNFLKSILTNFAVQIGDTEHAVSKFNDLYYGKIAVVLDEAVSFSIISADGKLKNFMTEPNMVVESKGLKKFEAKSFCRIFITTNEANPVKITESERRLVLLEPKKMTKELVDNVNKGPYSFIVSDLETCEDQTKIKNLKIIFDFLKNFKIIYKNQHEWEINRPITQKYLEVAEHFYKTEYYWLYNFSKNNDNKEIKASDCFKSYETCAKRNNDKFPMGPKNFGQWIKKDLEVLYKRKIDGIFYCFDYEKIKQNLETKKLYISNNDCPIIDDDDNDEILKNVGM